MPLYLTSLCFPMIVSKAFAKDSFKWAQNANDIHRDQKNGSNKAFVTYDSYF